MGMADRYYGIDPAGDANIQERWLDLYCDKCERETSQCVETEYAYGVLSWWGTWTCVFCKYEHIDDEGKIEYDYTDGME